MVIKRETKEEVSIDERPHFMKLILEKSLEDEQRNLELYTDAVVRLKKDLERWNKLVEKQTTLIAALEKDLNNQ